ncbi:MAG: toll/interleukin-1 receptor domain-containing protein [Pseudomonadota bacterium]
MTQVFISYAREDRERVEPFARLLEERGLDVWWDLQLEVGENYNNQISDQVDKCNCLIVFWSNNSVVSSYVRAECQRALALRKLLPVFIDGCHGQLPPGLNFIQGLDFDKELGENNFVNDLLVPQVLATVERSNPTIDLNAIGLVLGPPSQWIGEGPAEQAGAGIRSALCHGRAIIDWALSHSIAAENLRASGFPLAEFQACVENRYLDFRAALFDEFEEFARACCFGSPFLIFVRTDGEKVISHRFQQNRGQAFDRPVPELPLHSAEFYGSLLRRTTPKLQETRSIKIIEMVDAAIKNRLEIEPKPATEFFDAMESNGTSMSRGELARVQYTLRNSGVFAAAQFAAGPLNAKLTLIATSQLDALNMVKRCATDTLSAVLGAVSRQEVERLFANLDFALRPAA